VRTQSRKQYAIAHVRTQSRKQYAIAHVRTGYKKPEICKESIGNFTHQNQQRLLIGIVWYLSLVI